MPSTPIQIGCIYCNRTNFKSQHALNQHQKTGFCAKLKSQGKAGRTFGHRQGTIDNEEQKQDDDCTGIDDDMAFLPPDTPPRKKAVSRLELQAIEDHDLDAVAQQMGAMFDEDSGSDEESLEEAPIFSYFRAEEAPNAANAGPKDYSSEEYSDDGMESASDLSEVGANSTESNAPDTWIRDQFKEYCEEARKNFMPLSVDEVRTIRLLHLLKEKNSPMNAYDDVMLWHLKQANKLREHQTLEDYKGFIGRKTMIKKLIKRYNYESKLPYQKLVRLPVSGTMVKMTLHSAKATIQRLLTDPRIKDKDYLFFDRNPLKPPPESLDYVKDLNTGLAFTQTHALLVTKNGKQVMPTVIYSDGTAVSHFHDMEIIQVNVALGIMTREARTKGYCWAPLGYIEKIHEQGGRGRTILEEANHMETQDGADSVGSEETRIECEAVGDNSAQDFHAMMGVILEDFIEIQDGGGFLWDHHDAVEDKMYEDIHYELFVPFIRADSKEADAFCGKYGQRHSTQQICRKCHIPLQEADNHLAKYELKTVAEIKKLVEKADLVGLRALSQTYLSNAFHGLRFSMGNGNGIHGSCPSELLHAFLLGTFKYLRDIFFEMIGNDSEGARLMNALAKVYSKLFARQSDRTMPGTAFTRGIQVGKLMAKDYRGVLLIILAMLRSTKGRAILHKYRSFRKESDLDDWILLVELMLEWEAYLNEPLMYVKHVKRLERKHRFIMYIMRKVAQRTKGMGLKLVKFHMILHIWEDILQFGVPLEYDTSANESMHKPSKKASKMTQKAADTFNFQTAMRLIEFELLDLAMEEIQNGNVPWQYYIRKEYPGEEAGTGEEEPQNWTGETGIKVYWDEDGEPSFKLLTRSKFAAKTSWTVATIEFLLGLQDRLRAIGRPEPLAIFTCHRRSGQTFRGHPNYRGKGPWRDWVWVNWGSDGRFPCQIWCFVRLDGMPSGRNRIHYGGIPLEDGVFAVVETATVEQNIEEIGKSDLMTPVLKEVQLDADGNVQDRTFYLANTEAFEDPCCVIPDLGGPSNRYFVVKPRNQWAREFVRWIEDPHHLDEMDDLCKVEDPEEEEVLTAKKEETGPRRKKL